ncbi:DNA-methyltransferase [Oceanicella actignis]|uniref:site-specific DNA-methyltransferase (adenine-specific) n=1 Tax=Oceanicella actignis TaxID=1189325 RepID=A0A1M7U1W2_9RHOB|nr:DNA methyltransferase [Oceanicella actignis]SES76097.1 site-specific DNA-methyltransferase (adenine-specific) [Oceanicella actignis]SHN77052.1 site-specific DNA-methyltransferase (adenine-specific) [Oceanicella actignis]
MTPESWIGENFRDGGPPVALLEGDCLESVAAIPADTFDAIVTDPPYHLASIVKRFGPGASGAAGAAAGYGSDGAFQRASRGFMGREWDGGDIAFRAETWAALLRVAKPGAHLVAFNHSRTWHHMAVAIEAAGWDVRDTLAWLYGSGFPKSHDVSKGIDKALGRKRKVLSERAAYSMGQGRAMRGHAPGATAKVTAPATPEARAWQGWGTALKPAFEPVVLARKPLRESSVARQCLATGTGALNIDAARVGGEPWRPHRATGLAANKFFSDGAAAVIDKAPHDLGRWPANVLHDGTPEALAAFPRDQDGSLGRFFYSAKAGEADRRGSDHPTVKPQALMRWLVRLTTRRGGLILDPFGGSGSTGWAAAAEGVRAVLCERESDYLPHLRRRIAALDPEAQARESAADALPGQLGLF